MMTRRTLIHGGILSCLALGARPAYAIFGVGDVVLDPTNLIQNTLTAANMIRQVAQQAQQLTNEATQIANQMQQIQQGATNLARLPLAMSQELADLLGQYQQILGQAQGIAYQYGAVQGQFERLYGALQRGQPRDMVVYAQQLVAQLRQASGAAMQSQAVVERLAAGRASLRRALAASEAATGNLQVQQAGNQLAGMLATQQAQLIELIAATGRAETSLLAAQATLDEASRTNSAHAMQGWGRCDGCGQGLTALPKLH
jgi:type IV secretion system protein TrbJ